MIPKYTVGKITLALTGNADKVSDLPLYVTEFEVYNSPSNGTIYIGDSTVDTTWIPRAANTVTEKSLRDIQGEPKAYDLSQVYISGTSGDSVVIEYLKRV